MTSSWWKLCGVFWHYGMGFFFWRKPLPWFHMFISTCRNIFNVCGWTSEELSLWWRCSEIIWKEMLQKHNWQQMSHSRCLVKVICYVELCLCEGKEKMTFFSNTVVKTEVKVFSHFFFPSLLKPTGQRSLTLVLTKFFLAICVNMNCSEVQGKLKWPPPSTSGKVRWAFTTEGEDGAAAAPQLPLSCPTCTDSTEPSEVYWLTQV